MEDDDTPALAPELLSMEPLSPTILAPTGDQASSAAQQGKRSSGGVAMEESDDGPGRAELQGAEPLVVQSGKEMLEDWHPQRRDTTESWASDFSSRRTNTDFSIAASTATDITDLASPSIAFRDETFDFEDASLSRHNTLASPSVTFQKRLPFRGSSISFADPDKSRTPRLGSSPDNAPAPRHRRVEEMASRRPSLNRQPGLLSPSNTEPGPFSRSGPSPSNTTQPWNRAGDTTSIERPGDGEQSMPGALIPSAPATTEGRRIQEDEPNNAMPEDDVLTPGETETLSDDGFVTPNQLSGSMCSEASGLLGDEDGRSVFKPDDSMIGDVCDQVLKEAFGVQLQDLAGLGTVSAAYESVSYCLDELSHIVLGSGHSSAGPPIRESTRGTAGHNTTPIRPAGGSTNSGETGSESGGSNGNGGGSQKRPNGGHDGAGAGYGAGDGSPGGGKRQKVSSTPQSALQTPALRLSCPFRKRNPVKFNVRDFQSCAVQSFPDIPQLKRHVKVFHKQKIGSVMFFACPRCKQDMGTKEAFDDHLAVANEQICNFLEVPSSADPEDGITSRIEDILIGRKAGSKIDSWENLWRLLFPRDAQVKIPDSDFVPPIELEEVYAQFKTERCGDWLRQQVQEGLGTFGHGQSVHNNIDSMLDMFQDYIDSVFNICRTERSGVTGRPRKTRAQTARQTTSLQRSGQLNSGQSPVPQGGRGLGGRRISVPVSTSGSDGSLGSLEQPEMAMPQPDVGYEYATGIDDGLMAPVIVGSADTDYNSQPVTVPAAAHLHHGFASQGQNTVGALGGQLGHQHRLQSSDSGVDLNATFPIVTSFRAQNAYPNLSFGQRAPPLPFRPSPQGGQLFSPTDPSMGPSVHLWQPMTDLGGYEYLPPQ